MKLLNSCEATHNTYEAPWSEFVSIVAKQFNWIEDKTFWVDNKSYPLNWVEELNGKFSDDAVVTWTEVWYH